METKINRLTSTGQRALSISVNRYLISPKNLLFLLFVWLNSSPNGYSQSRWTGYKQAITTSSGGVSINIQYTGCTKSGGVNGYPKINIQHTFPYPATGSITLEGLQCDGSTDQSQFIMGRVSAHQEYKSGGNWHLFKDVQRVVKAEFEYDDPTKGRIVIQMKDGRTTVKCLGCEAQARKQQQEEAQHQEEDRQRQQSQLREEQAHKDEERQRQYKLQQQQETDRSGVAVKEQVRRDEQIDRQKQQIIESAQQEVANIKRQQAQNEQAIQVASEALAELISMEVEDLRSSEIQFIISGGIGGLVSPMITSDQTNAGGLTYNDWNVNMAILSRKGISISFAMNTLSQINEDFLIRAQTQAGNFRIFKGVLKVNTTNYLLTLGKDIGYSKNGRFHLLIGPTIGYMEFDEHGWEYNSSQAVYQEKNSKMNNGFGVSTPKQLTCSQIDWA